MSNDNDDSRVEFEIDVTQSPTARARIEALTKLVVDGQAKMSAGVERMGLMAQTAAAGMSPLVAKMEAFKKSSMAGVDGLRSEFSKLDSAAGKRIDRTIKVDIIGMEKVKELEASIDRMAAVAGRGPNVPSPIPGMPGPSGADRGRNGGPSSGMDVPDNLRGMFKKLEAEAGSSADKIGKAMDDKIGKLPKLQEGTESLKKAFKERSDAAKKLRDDYERAVDNMGEASERMNSNLVKGARSLIGMTKGFAELGLMSAESTEQLAKGMVAVQGAFDIFDGAADLLESVQGSRKARKMGRRAAAEVAETGAAMAGGAMAKSVGGRLMGAGAATAAAGVGANALGVGAGAAGAGGAGATAVGATGLLAPVAAAGAALAALGLVAVELKETFSGTATKAGSVTDTIAQWEVGIAASLVRFGRTDKSVMESGNNMGANELARSQIRAERAEYSLKKNRIDASQKEGTENIARDTQNEKDQRMLQDSIRMRRARTENTSGVDSVIAFELKTKDTTGRQMAASQRISDKGQSGDVDAATAARADAEVRAAQDQMMKSQFRQNFAMTSKAGGNLAQEQGIGASVNSDLLRTQKELDNLRKNGVVTAGYEAANLAKQASLSATLVESLERQKSLTKEKLSIELQGQSQVRDLLKSQLDLTTQKLERSQDAKAAAIGNFSRLGEIEKQQAIKALEQGRVQGGGSLRDEQKDLLRSVGTKEAVRLANQGDEDEARRFGFSDKNFGAGFDQEQAGLLKAKQQIEANLSTSYDVSVKLNADTGAIVDGVMSKVEGLMLKSREDFGRALDAKASQMQVDLSNRSGDQLRQLGKARS